MKHSSSTPEEISARASQIGEPRQMRRGSIVERRVRCSKPNCACKDDEGARHGPYLSLTRSVHGVTRTRLLTPAQAEVARGQIEAGREFRDATDLFWQACERVADAELDALAEGSEQGAEKGGSRRRSKPRSSPRSKRS